MSKTMNSEKKPTLAEQLEEIKDWIETSLDGDAHGKWFRAPKFEIIQDVAELLAPRFIKRLHTAETSIRQEAFEEGKKKGRDEVLQEVEEWVENVEKPNCSLCGCAPTEPPHYEENGVWFCPHNHHQCKSSTAPCINISGTDETKGYNQALSDLTTALTKLKQNNV